MLIRWGSLRQCRVSVREKRQPKVKLCVEVTGRGSELVLLRLADAIAEAGEGAGVQLHRSHWVAVAAISKVTHDNCKPSVETTGITRLPVNLTYLSVLKKAGLSPC